MASRRWHPETFVCAFRGHHVPAMAVAHLRPEDSGLGVDLPDGRRLARCVRCDGWIAVAQPSQAGGDSLPPLQGMTLPRRGSALRDAIVLRIIAVSRAVHCLFFGLIAVGAFFIEIRLPGFKASVSRWLLAVEQAGSSTGATSSHPFVSKELRHLLQVRSSSLRLVIIMASLYCVLEGVEAVGLWRERRWAEYLTAVATAGFLPLEIRELAKRLTVLRVSALVINLAILIYLVWQKRLFGLARLRPPKHQENAADAAALFGPATLGTPHLRSDRAPH